MNTKTMDFLSYLSSVKLNCTLKEAIEHLSLQIEHKLEKEKDTRINRRRNKVQEGNSTDTGSENTKTSSIKILKHFASDIALTIHLM
jgi:hypothetical protein